MYARLLTFSSTLAILLVFPLFSFANPDPCLMVYTTSPTIYHYDVNEYYTVTPGHPLYDPFYDRGGEVLIDIKADEIPLDVYQVPNLVGFKPSSDGEDGYFCIGSEFDLVIDGFSKEPTTFVNILIVFEPDPASCSPSITVDGDKIAGDTYPCQDLVVSTPTPYGNNYSDTITKHIVWGDCYGIRIWAFADENYNGKHDGDECSTAFSHDLTVPTEKKSWGAIKSLYKE